jgi:hypothetical protein
MDTLLRLARLYTDASSISIAPPPCGLLTGVKSRPALTERA